MEKLSRPLKHVHVCGEAAVFKNERTMPYMTQRLGVFGERAGLFGVCFGLVRLRVRVALAFAVVAIALLLPRMQRFILCRTFVAGVSADVKDVIKRF